MSRTKNAAGKYDCCTLHRIFGVMLDDLEEATPEKWEVYAMVKNDEPTLVLTVLDGDMAMDLANSQDPTVLMGVASAIIKLHNLRNGTAMRVPMVPNDDGNGFNTPTVN